MFSNLLETIVQVAQLIVPPDHRWRHRVVGEAWPRLFFGKVFFVIAGFRKHSATKVAADFGAWITGFVVITATEASRILWLSIKAQVLTASKYKANCIYRRALQHDCIPFHRVYFVHRLLKRRWRQVLMHFINRCTWKSSVLYYNNHDGVIHAYDLYWCHISMLVFHQSSCVSATILKSHILYLRILSCLLACLHSAFHCGFYFLSHV